MVYTRDGIDDQNPVMIRAGMSIGAASERESNRNPDG